MNQAIEEGINRIVSAVPFERVPWNDKPSEVTLAERMEYHNVPGISVAVMSGGEIDWARSFGVKEAGTNEPVSTDTIFQAGSISKAVTAVAVLRMVEQGTLSLDEDVNTYLTSWKVPENDDWQPRVTLRHLLSHSAGTTVHGFPGYPRGSEVPTLVQVLNGEKPANTPRVYVNMMPGTRFRYSGGGTSIVQQVLVDVLGKPFPQIMRELVLDPAGMVHSTFEQPLPEPRWDSAATGHYWVPNNPVQGKWHIYPEMAAAGLWTTASDLARFITDIWRALQGKSHKLLSGDMAEQMLTPQGVEHMGLGFFLEGAGDAARFGHDGDDHGFVASLKMYRASGSGVAIMTNGFAGSGLIEELRNTIAREYDWPDYPYKERTQVPVDTNTYDAYVGEYKPESGKRWNVTREGDHLTLQVPGQNPIVLYPQSETKFFAKAVDTTVSFTRSKDGQVTELTLTQDDEESKATK